MRPSSRRANKTCAAQLGLELSNLAWQASPNGTARGTSVNLREWPIGRAGAELRGPWGISPHATRPTQPGRFARLRSARLIAAPRSVARGTVGVSDAAGMSMDLRENRSHCEGTRLALEPACNDTDKPLRVSDFGRSPRRWESVARCSSLAVPASSMVRRGAVPAPGTEQEPRPEPAPVAVSRATLDRAAPWPCLGATRRP
jgi:hypothetical protein